MNQDGTSLTRIREEKIPYAKFKMRTSCISELRKRTHRTPTAGHCPQYGFKIEPKNARHFDNLEIITKPKIVISFHTF